MPAIITSKGRGVARRRIGARRPVLDVRRGAWALLALVPLAGLAGADADLDELFPHWLDGPAAQAAISDARVTPLRPETLPAPAPIEPAAEPPAEVGPARVVAPAPAKPQPQAAKAAKAKPARRAAPKSQKSVVVKQPVVTEGEINRVIEGRASWYGPGFHGETTAAGETFDRHALTLAHRHLPLGTRVRITNLKTGKSAIARVNDRGPFHRSRIADLSEGLAKRVGMKGVGRVRIEVLEDAE